MKTDNVEAQKSKIHGTGVFATRDFQKGETVLHWDTSHLLTKEKFEALSENEKNYVTFLEGKYIAMQGPEKYVNHSCEANTNAENFTDVATRDIATGEEITSDYSAEMPPGIEMVCNCGSKNCKRIIK